VSEEKRGKCHLVVLGALTRRHDPRATKTEVGAEGVEDDGSTHVGCLEVLCVDGLVGREEEDLEEADNKELLEGDLKYK